ncbi:MAG: replicative DNA helicase [Christensenellales bacterium]|uniref:replicative DNA helicase n=1 Tax=Butyribacter sp. TaxID=2822465 RepID=UPI0003350C68|nr:replicative DNA helicase [Clostridium sp.]MDY5181980.1 replicative DNA helicase [Butyribacter sp.]CDB90794.1 replicative DNA helicase [Clostridium sp. CAG:253]
MEEEVIKRLPPNNVEAEKAVIGAMMLDSDAIMVCSEILTAGEFYQQQYGIIFDALVEMYRDGIGADLVTIQNKLREKEVTPELYSVEYLGELLASVPTSANVKFYAEIVHEKAVLRRLIKVTEQVTRECYMDSQPLEDILEDTEKSVFDVIQQRGGSEFEPIRDVVLRTLDSIEKAAKQKGNITGLETGFRDLDAKTAGLQKSDLILIAARPAMGKTAFVLNIAEYVALHSNSTIALFSLEMSKEQLVKRMLAMNSMVDSQKIRTGDLEDDDWDKLVGSVRKIGNSNLVIDDTSGITASELRSKCRKLKIEQGLDLVIIDYLQLMTGAGKRKSDSRQQEISDISRSLKVMARELDVPVIALSQLSRAVESRPDKRPMLSDLRESGAIEQDADIVMFIYRDEYYNPDSEKKGVAEVIVAKQRSGPTGPVELAWLSQYTKFGNLEYQR